MSLILMRFIRDNSGTTAVDYALIAFGVSVGLLSVVKNLVAG
jgi:Flp pilus assembly pilin Flp